jgi:hypothetical protein
MKKNVCILFAIVMILSLVACSASAQPTKWFPQMSMSCVKVIQSDEYDIQILPRNGLTQEYYGAFSLGAPKPILVEPGEYYIGITVGSDVRGSYTLASGSQAEMIINQSCESTHWAHLTVSSEFEIYLIYNSNSGG